MEIKISVRNLIEFVLRTGDLDNRYTGASRMLEGTLAHQKLQKSSSEGYCAEVSVKLSVEYKGFLITIDGRVDGIFVENNLTVIDEIKTTTLPIEIIGEDHNMLHWAQVKCYAFIYAAQNNLEIIDAQLTYYQLDSEEVKIFRKSFHIEELKDFMYSIIEKYVVWANYTSNWNTLRDSSIKNLKFPFESFRKGQKELIKAVYKTITGNKKLFVQAPTGTGKTISTLYPAVKAIGEGHISKIFYLTARTTTRRVAEEAFIRMKENGLEFKTITLTAKEKICFNKGSACNPDQCEYARGYFDRVNDAIFSILSNENNLSRDMIEAYAMKYKVCPFEYSLDLTLWADCIICDYNYIFDPRVYLKRFFMNNKGDYAFLVDEAHNLVDRARDMYSSGLSKNVFLEMKKLMKGVDKKIYKILDKVNSYFIDIGHKCDENLGTIIETEEPKEIYPFLKKFIKEVDIWLIENAESIVFEKLQELYFEVMFFIKVSELYDNRYVTYYETARNDLNIKQYCLDPSFLLSEAVKTGKTAVFFSATLTPLSYFRNILGGGEDSYKMKLPSPFFSENLCLLISDNISTKFKNRENSYEGIAEYIKTLIVQKTGNYMVYFPSYKYMNEVVSRFILKTPHTDIIIQSSSMSEEERVAFLERFQTGTEKTLVGFCVLGGVFSEGVDLTGDRLIGAVIVGVGLPQLNLEQNIVMNYFNEKNYLGYEYAYMFPGMNKVLQAAGRVIRTESDRGAVLLIDERFSHDNYSELFPDEWSHNIKVRKSKELEEHLKNFWD